MKTSEEYAQEGGVTCPVCGSDEIDTGSLQVYSSIAWADCECLVCESTWRDQYKLIGYVNMKGLETHPLSELEEKKGE